MDSLTIRFGPEAFRQQQGGVSRYFANLHRGLLEAGHDSVIFAGLHSNRNLTGAPNVMGYSAPTFTGRPVLNRMAFAASILLSDTRQRILHETYYTGRRLRGAKSRYAITFFDMIHQKAPVDLPNAEQTVRRQQYWINAADIVFTISNATRADVLNYFDVDPDRIIVTPLGLDRDLVFGASATARTDRFEEPVLLYVGSRKTYKNWSTLVYALSRLDVPFTLICVGGGGFTKAELDLLSQLGLVQLVRQVEVGDEELARLYATAAATVVPSCYEGFGLPALEAMANGCPVLYSRIPALVEVVGHAGISVPPLSIDDWSHEIHLLLADDSARYQLSELGRQRARQFTWDRTVEKTVEGYRQLLS